MIGLDVSEGMLAQARRQNSIGLVQARAEAIPLRDATVDFVSISYALRHVADLERVFSELLRVLKPGGRLLVACVLTQPGATPVQSRPVGDRYFWLLYASRTFWLTRPRSLTS